MKGYAILALLALASPASGRADYLRAQGTQIVDGSGRPITLRGMGLGGWMLQEGYMLKAGGLQQHVIRRKMAEMIGAPDTARFYRAWLDNFITERDVAALAGWGFNTIRVPMHHELFVEVGADGTPRWRPEGFRLLDRLIGWSRQHGLWVFLDMHAAPGGQGADLAIADRDPALPSLWQSPQHQRTLVALWGELARRYRDEPTVGGYDIINEPNWDFTGSGNANGCKETDNGQVEALEKRIVQAIRVHDTRHLVVVEGNCWSNNYDGMKLDWDDNLVIGFHKYWNDTSAESLRPVLALRDRYKRPVWLGESGENSNDWFAKTVRTVEANGIGWSWWPLKKFGHNNPLQIMPQPAALAAMKYFAGEGPRPDVAAARAALLRLAERDVRFENNVRHPDVVDALIRQPSRPGAIPFRRHVAAPGGFTIQAADYDMGENGVAYSDTLASDLHITTGGGWVKPNEGETYRNDGVDIVMEGGVPVVTDVKAGEWSRYTVEAPRAASYTITVRFAGGHAGPMTLDVNGRRHAAGTVFRNVRLTRGANVLVLTAGEDGIRPQALVATPADSTAR